MKAVEILLNSRGLVILLSCAVLLFSCIDLGQESEDGPSAVETIFIHTGLTDSTSQPSSLGMTEMAYYYRLNDSSGVKISWLSVDDAEYYEIRVSKQPVTVENWDGASLAAKVENSEKDTIVHTIVRLHPQIIGGKCTGCGACVAVCPKNAISLINKVAVIDIAKCIGCGKCYDTCSYNAVTNCFLGEAYYYAVRSFSSNDVGSEKVVCTEKKYLLRYTNWLKTKLNINKCVRCGSGCYILEKKYGPGCPVNAIYWETYPDGSTPVFIDQSKCIYCGQCLLQCGVLSPGAWSIRKEVLETE